MGLKLSVQKKGDMNKDATIYVAGPTGVVGSSLVRLLIKRYFTNLLLGTHAELDKTIGTRILFRNQDLSMSFSLLGK